MAFNKDNMINYVVSRYTSIFSMEIEGVENYLIYNSITNSFTRVNKIIFENITHAKKKGKINKSIFSQNVLEYLEKAKIIVTPIDDDAYVRQCEINTFIGNFASSHMSLSLAPTSSCNFACPYCYEKSKPNKTMTDDIIDNLIKFINGHKDIKTVGITWYGGEPLVAFGTIKKIVKKIHSDCEAKLTYQDIVTNGYNFDYEVIEFFKDHPLKRIQITIDGPEEKHNKLRKLVGGGGTYKKIINNIHSIITGLPDTEVVIRVNIGKNNWDSYSILCKELQEKFSNKISVYPGFIRIHDKKQTHLICDSMEQKDAISFYKQLEDEGDIKINYYPNQCKKRGCVATCATAYVIGPMGELYKCWNDIGNENMIIGSITNEKLIRSDLYNQYMIDGQWTSDEECKKCFFLPICSGGCAWQRIRNKFYRGRYNYCSIYKVGGIETFLKTYYKKTISKTIK